MTELNFSAIVFEDRSVTTALDQDLLCTVSGLSQDTPVTWIDPDNNEISNSDTDNYVINQGSLIFGSKASTLTITPNKLASLSSGDVFKCKLKSARYPADSPEVVREMTLTLLSLGKTWPIITLVAHRLVLLCAFTRRDTTVTFFIFLIYIIYLVNCYSSHYTISGL